MHDYLVGDSWYAELRPIDNPLEFGVLRRLSKRLGFSIRLDQVQQSKLKNDLKCD